MASETEIANLALQKLGDEGEINSLQDDTRAARAISACFVAMRDATLRDHPWSFAKHRESLAALVDAPAWGGLTAFQKPADFIRFVDEEEGQSYKIEGDTILADTAGPLNILYVRQIAETGKFDPLFVDALATRIAWQVAMQLTGSKQLKGQMWDEYLAALATAKGVNARENLPAEQPEDDWVTSRERGA